MTTRTTARTPYELRLELLQLAFEVLTKKHAAASTDSKINTSPTTEEIITEADKMNVFISKATQVH
jgi:hypothetical protein